MVLLVSLCLAGKALLAIACPLCSFAVLQEPSDLLLVSKECERSPVIVVVFCPAGFAAAQVQRRSSLEKSTGTVLDSLGGAGTLSRPASFLRRLLVKPVAAVSAAAEEEEDESALEEDEDDLGEDDMLGMPQQGETDAITL